MTERIPPTITEQAFIKAKQLDAIIGYYLTRKNEMKDCTVDVCDLDTCQRYQIDFSDAAAMIIGALQKYMK